MTPRPLRTPPLRAGKNDASRWLRTRTLRRTAHEYLRWARETFGWATLVYLLFWLGVGLVTTVQTVQATEPQNLPLQLVPWAAHALTLLAILLGLSSRVPPVILNRRDVHRLALAPVAASHVLAWPLLQARALRFSLGLLLGGSWSLFAPVLFGVSAPFAPLAVAAVLLAGVDVAWLGYVAREGSREARRMALGVTGTALVLALIGIVSPYGLASALYQPGALALLAPVLLAGVTLSATRRSLQAGYPASFVAHSLILGQLRAVNLNAQWLGGQSDPDLVRRLRAQLRGDPRGVRPSRFLPPPPAGWGVTGALVWRGLLLMWRRPLREQLVFAGRFLFCALLVLLAPGNVIAQAFLAMSLATLAQALLVPLPAGSRLPLTGRARTLGRVMPGAGLIVLLALAVILGAFALGQPSFVQATLLAALQILFAGVALEKLTRWTQLGRVSVEAAFAVGLLATLSGVFLPFAWALPTLMVMTGLLLASAWV